MEIKLLAGSFLILAPISFYLVYKTQVCLYYGKAIASEEFLAINPSGFQDALSDPSTNLWFFLIQGLMIANVVLIFYFGSIWLGFGSIVAYYVIGIILQRVLPSTDSPKWALGLHRTLSNREADFKKAGDELRYEAAKDLRLRFESKLSHIFFK